jgi:hypothetical protein
MLSSRRLLALVGAFGALTLVAGIVPAAGERTVGAKSQEISLAVFVCIGDTSDQNCGPGHVKVTGHAKLTKRDGETMASLGAGRFPPLAKRAGIVAVVASGKTAFSCPGPCSGFLPAGVPVTVKAKPFAQPNRRYHFVKMESDGCSTPETQNPCLLTLDSPTKVKVVFAPGG